MNVGDIITDYNGNKYKVITAGNKPNTPFISNNIVNNDIVWGDIHLRNWGGDDINYSEDEVCIGTWIDGKPLYRKVFDNPTNNMSTGLTNFNARRIYGEFIDTNVGNYISIPWNSGSFLSGHI